MGAQFRCGAAAGECLQSDIRSLGGGSGLSLGLATPECFLDEIDSAARPITRTYMAPKKR